MSSRSFFFLRETNYTATFTKQLIWNITVAHVSFVRRNIIHNKNNNHLTISFFLSRVLTWDYYSADDFSHWLCICLSNKSFRPFYRVLKLETFSVRVSIPRKDRLVVVLASSRKHQRSSSTSTCITYSLAGKCIICRYVRGIDQPHDV